jgi:hypothetical protein
LNSSGYGHLSGFIENIDFLNSSKEKTIIREILSSRELKKKPHKKKCTLRLTK